MLEPIRLPAIAYRVFLPVARSPQRYKPARAAQLMESISRAFAQQLALCLGDTVSERFLMWTVAFAYAFLALETFFRKNSLELI